MEAAPSRAGRKPRYVGFLIAAVVSGCLLGRPGSVRAFANCKPLGSTVHCFAGPNQLLTVSADAGTIDQIDKLRERLLKSLNTPGQSEPFDQLMEKYAELLRPPS